MQKTKTNRVSFSAMAKAWKAPFVSRQKVGEFSGGLLNPRTLANMDHKGEGPKGRVRMGRAVAYPVKELVEWMEERAEQL